MTENCKNKSELEQELKKLIQEIDENWFSTELLSRELYYLGYYSDKGRKEDYQQLVKHFENTGQPFELVDGDTLNFVADTYQNLFDEY